MASLFNSSITLENIQSDLQAHFKTDSKFGPNVNFRDLGEGNGIVSQVGLLTADWQPFDDNLPATFAIKVATSADVQTDNELQKLARKTDVDEAKQQRIVNYHNTEISILTTLQKNHVNVKLAEVYSWKERKNFKDDGYIVMKHFGGVTSSLHMNNNLTEAATKDLIQQLSEIHKSAPLFSEKEQAKMQGNTFQETFNIMFEPAMIKNLGLMIKSFGGELMAKESEELLPVLDEMKEPSYLKWVDETCENLGVSRMLCHGDVWMCNMLLKRTGDGPSNEEYELEALIDLQTAQIGNPAIDLVRLFTGCLSGKARRDNWEKYVKLWWTKMNTGPVTCPYTYDQILEAYYRVFPAAAFVVAGSIGAVGPNIVKKQPDEEAQKQAHKNLLEKQHAILQDIIHFHKRNMSLIKGEEEKCMS